MNKICTSKEQSNKLIELGIDVNTADMYYEKDTTYPKILTKYEITYANVLYGSYDIRYFNIFENTPAWSLSALMNILPSEFTEVGKYSTTIYEIKIRKYNLIEDVNLYQIAYGNYKFHEEDGHSYWKDMINTGEKEDLLDAVFQMICWLKENNKI